MRIPPRTQPDFPIVETSRQVRACLSVDELARAAGISRTMLARLLNLGLVEPLRGARGLAAPTFSAATALRLRRMLRLRRDLGVNLVGAAIIVDLIERLDRQPTNTRG